MADEGSSVHESGLFRAGLFKCMKQKYSSYLLNVRIELAKRLIWYFPEIKLSQIAEEVGYPADSQYFPRPSENRWNVPFEYKDYIQKQA